MSPMTPAIRKNFLFIVTLCLYILFKYYTNSHRHKHNVYNGENSPRVVEHFFNISWIKAAPNGIPKQVLGVNGQFPGPTLDVMKGDTLRIHVSNFIQTRIPTSIHWHGINQRGSQNQDGVHGATQCPIPYGVTNVYEFKLEDSGTYFWHSHYAAQRADGLWGLLIVRNRPEVWGHLYDEGKEVIISITEWFLKTGQQVNDWTLGPMNKYAVTPVPHSVLINGRGFYPCEYAALENVTCHQVPDVPTVIQVIQGSTYRFRLISAASARHVSFSIDNHTIQIIEVDGVDTQLSDPLDIIRISTGTRFSFLVKMTMNNTPEVGSEFLIRVKSLPLSQFQLIDNLHPYPEIVPLTEFAILKYVQEESKQDQPSIRQTELERKPITADDYGIQLVESQHCIPFKQENRNAPDYFDEEFVINFNKHKHKDGSTYFTTNGNPYNLTDDQVPILLDHLNLNERKHLSQNLTVFHSRGQGKVIQLVINNRDHFWDGHPVHLHGHDFWIVGRGELGEGDYNSAIHSTRLKSENVVKRDIARFHGDSWLVLRYIADNPGIWLFHCHVTWHVHGGMAAIIVEDPDIVKSEYQPKKYSETYRVCHEGGVKVQPPSGDNSHYV